MAKPAMNPFEEEKPQIVHLEKSQSHYEYCRMQMHDIEKVHRRTFMVNLGICLIVAMLAIFRQYIAGFDLLSRDLAQFDKPGTILTGGIFQILFCMGTILIGYLAWANFHTLNIIQECWYFLVTFLGVIRLDYLSAVIGMVGLVFYFYSLKAMSHEAQLAEMDGYPDFQERFDISQSDIVIETLLAHKGEKRTKSTLFTTDYSLRRKKKKRAEETGKDASKELAAEIRKRLEQVEAAKHPENAEEAKKAEEAKQAAEKAAQSAAEMQDIVNPPAEEAKAADPDAIIAEAEAKAKAILEQALAEAAKVKEQTAHRNPTN